MIARGDLGVETRTKKCRAFRDEIILECRKKGKPVIVATHMLESMIQYPMPTRAEVMDISRSDGTDRLYDALGRNSRRHVSVQIIDAMSKILDANEKNRLY